MTKKQKRSIAAIIAVGVVVALCVLFIQCAPHVSRTQPTPTPTRAAADHITVMAWNLRGYPESDQVDRQWFTSTVNSLAPDVMCVEEIASQSKVDTFLKTENYFTEVAFSDSSDGQDNAIFATSRITMQDRPDIEGFQRPEQVAYIAYGGFDGTIVTGFT